MTIAELQAALEVAIALGVSREAQVFIADTNEEIYEILAVEPSEDAPDEVYINICLA